MRRLMASLACVGLAGCATPVYQGKPDPEKPHHTANGFQNLPGGLDKPAFSGFLKWQWQRLVVKREAQEYGAVAHKTIDPNVLRRPQSGWRLTWLGHASVHLQIDGLQILIDPVLSGRASPFAHLGPQAYSPSPIALQDLPRIDLVLISHNHYDHLDARTVRALATQPGGPPVFVVPLGVDRYLRDWGIGSIRIMDWLDSFSITPPLRGAQDLTIHMIPAHHWSRRTLWDTNQTLWAGFRLQSKDLHLVYTGDTGYSTIFEDMARHWSPIDWLLVPVGCYEPRWFMRAQHVNPVEAQQITQDLGARNALGVHWGVFRLCDEPVEQPMIDLQTAQEHLPESATRIQMWAIGESRVLTP
jgi:N-acyl-phosphatidylethanolamine-hydrolysing phospholipase D